MGRNLGPKGIEAFLRVQQGVPGVFPNIPPKHPAFETSLVWARPQTPCGPHCFPGPACPWPISPRGSTLPYNSTPPSLWVQR